MTQRRDLKLAEYFKVQKDVCRYCIEVEVVGGGERGHEGAEFS